ncbi:MULTISPECIES: Nramp family divalent metal transporter [unclassified Paraflavitalea]|uniref:Nramp family divalent metal transporter n=1 Tax=unclassified Paraflavitalea TaxID=2798305 RepID=UPI003D353B0B
MSRTHNHSSLSEVHESVDVSAKKTGWRKVLAFFGPAYLVSVGYMDPGNWATDLAGGSKFGYTLIWVLLMSNLMALLLQSLATRLGIVQGRDLAQANHEAFPKQINFLLYVLAEIAIAATDLAEVLGMAIGIHLLTGLPLIWGVAITVLDTLLLLFLQRLGIRKMEAFIIGLVSIVGLSFLIEIILAKPSVGAIAGGFIPKIPNDEALYIAIGIIGATVMPHNLYLHSALVQTRKINKSDAGIKQALKWNFLDSAIALNIAFLVNAAILILAAKVFFESGRTEVAALKDAHNLLNELLGTNLAPALFAIALIAAGQSSTVTGTLAGQIVMEGYLQLRINPWIRRLLTRILAIAPAIIVIYVFGENEVDSLLILSQVILSLQLGFAIIPLIHFVSDKSKMGSFAIKVPTKIAAWLIAAILVILNIKMVINEVTGFYASEGYLFWKILIGVILFIFSGLLFYITFVPFFKNKQRKSQGIHKLQSISPEFQVPQYKKIAVALDFSANDQKILAHAIGQGREETEYYLIHVVESVSAGYLGQFSDDMETRADNMQLHKYINDLRNSGIKADGALGYHLRTKEIVRLVKNSEADLLVIGAHGHAGIKDWIYGETINSVRHELTIPVLIVYL